MLAKYRRKPIVVDAVKITSAISIETTEGTLKGQPGDYLITHADGTQYPCNNETFKATYEPVKTYVDVKKYLYKVVRRIKHKFTTQ